MGEKSKSISFKCKIGWHNWSRFGSPKKGYDSLLQFRQCKVCGIGNVKPMYDRAVTNGQLEEIIKEYKDV